jgi:hypothetical protein
MRKKFEDEEYKISVTFASDYLKRKRTPRFCAKPTGPRDTSGIVSGTSGTQK